MILVDTSVWIEMFAGRVRARPEDFLSMATCGPIIQEVVQGLRPGSQSQLIRWQLSGLPRLGDPVTIEIFLEAADLYAASRRRGITIRSSVNCLIASIALRHKTPVWHLDRDFERIATFTELEIWSPDPGGLV